MQNSFYTTAKQQSFLKQNKWYEVLESKKNIYTITQRKLYFDYIYGVSSAKNRYGKWGLMAWQKK